MMTINEMIERLEDYRSMLGGLTEVRLMTQQNYPFENTVHGLVSNEEINDVCDDEEEDKEDECEDLVLYVVEGEQLDYGTKKAWDVAR